MTEDQAFIEWKAEQYKHQNTEEEMEFVEHLHNFPRYFKKTFIDGYHEGQKEHEWHDINDTEPSKEQLGKQLLIRMKSITGNTEYEYFVYKYTGESIADVPGVIAWKEIEK